MVVGVSGSDASLAALRWVIGQADLTGVTVQAVSCFVPMVPYPPTDRRTVDCAVARIARYERRLLEAQVAPLRSEAGVDITTSSLEGRPAKVLSVVGIGAEMLVLGRSHIGRAVGPRAATLRAMIRRAPCPLVVIPAPDRDRPRTDVHR
jgi:nucleotide-binding universal stress UspA family protein